MFEIKVRRFHRFYRPFRHRQCRQRPHLVKEIRTNWKNEHFHLRYLEMDEFFDDPSDQGLADRFEIISPSTSFHPVTNASSRQTNDVLPSVLSTGDFTRESQKAILSALMKLQDDVHHILERLNRLETSDFLLQQV